MTMRLRPLHFTLGQFRATTAHLPDDTPVLIPARDHSYRDASVEECDGLYHAKDQVWSEDWDCDFDDEDSGKGFVRLKIIVVGR